MFRWKATKYVANVRNEWDSNGANKNYGWMLRKIRYYIWSCRYDCPAKTNGRLLEKSKLRELIEPDASRAFLGLDRFRCAVFATLAFALASANCTNCTHGRSFLITLSFSTKIYSEEENKFHPFSPLSRDTRIFFSDTTSYLSLETA